MRICLVSKQFEPLVAGGIGTYVSIFCGALASAGHEVHVLTEPHARLAEVGARLRPGVRFHAVDVRRGRAALDAYPVGAMRYSMGVYESLLVLHGRGAFDYIEFPDYLAEGYFALRAKRTLGAFSGAVMAVRLHSPWSVMREHDRQFGIGKDEAYVDHMEAAAIAEADLLLSPSRALLNVAVAIGTPGIAPNAAQRREVVRLPFDPVRSAAELGARAEAAAGSGAEQTVLYFGRVQYLKGPHLIVEAGQRLLESGVEARFRFIGSDTPTGPFGRSMTDWCRSRIQPRWRDRFVFEGPRPRSELGRALGDATVCVLPSLWENFAMAAIEAMAMGACVVASDAGGFPEMIRDGVDGLVFRSGDAGSLESVLRRALGDAGLRASVGASARARVGELCDPASLIARLETLVAECRRAPARVAQRHAPASGPEVSVVIPYYNMGRYLPETLASVRGQTFNGYEVLVVNDGSTDPASLERLRTLEEPGLRVLHKPNGGLGSARNHGLREARGRYVLPLDSDDLLDPTFLEKTVRVMRESPGVAVVSALGLNFEEDPARPHGGWCPLGLDRDMLAVVNIGAASGSLLDREAAMSVGGYDEWLTSYEDWDFWCRLAERGHVGVVVPEFLFQYRVRPDSMFRTEALSRHGELRAHLIRAHPRLAKNSERAMRMEAGGVGDWVLPGLVEKRAQELCRENLRYRIADRLNGALKIMRVHRAIKTVAGGLSGHGNGPDHR